MNSVCIISQGFPYNNDPFFAFVGELAEAFARSNVKCYVIVPQSITKAIVHNTPLRPEYWTKRIENQIIEVYQPKYITLSETSNKAIGNLVLRSFCYAVRRIFNKHIKGKVDCLYGHFWYSGICAGMLAKEHNIPGFVATGESRIDLQDKISLPKFDKALDGIDGVICVSSKNKEESISIGLANEIKCIVIPNSVNTDLFCKMDKNSVRKELGFSESDFIVSFVGAFIHRKGTLRVSEAIGQLSDVKSIFIGKGDEIPSCPGVLFSGQLPHDEIPKYLNASDVFVLPTLAEGCCNAIIEALACGVPVISSDRSFNDDILSEEYSLRIDPENVNDIRNAIAYLRDHPEIRVKMAAKAYEYGSKMSISNRAQRIITFIDEKINAFDVT